MGAVMAIEPYFFPNALQKTAQNSAEDIGLPVVREDIV